MFMLMLYTEGRSFDNAVATVVHLSISSIPLLYNTNFSRGVNFRYFREF